jgi:hypothetical protein
LALRNAIPVRFVRTLNGEAPPPGRNRSRRQAWTNHPQLDLDVGVEQLPLVNLLMDWAVRDDEPIIFVSLPRGPWKYGTPMRVAWREPLPRGKGGIAGLSFRGDDGGDPLTLTVDPSEEAASS